jgi:hypothetical protein
MNRDKKRRAKGSKAGRDFVLAKMYSLICKNEYNSYGYNVFLGTKNGLQKCT